MYSITRVFHFAAGHTLYQHLGKCKNLHGHNYRLEVTVVAHTLDSQGMVMDFGDLKQMVQPVVNGFDHRFLVCIGDPRAVALQELDSTVLITDNPPTAETIATLILNALDQLVTKVTLYETEDSYATVWRS